MRLNNDNFLTIINFIDTNYTYLSLKELIVYCSTSGLYKDLYLNWKIIEVALNEHNEKYKD